MTIDNLKQQIEETLSTTRKSFKLGELRILAVLFLLLLAPAGARPTSVLRLRFGDIRVVLARDPEGGPHKILVKFTLAFTKTYLGIKDAYVHSHGFGVVVGIGDPANAVLGRPSRSRRLCSTRVCFSALTSSSWASCSGIERSWHPR